MYLRCINAEDLCSDDCTVCKQCLCPEFIIDTTCESCTNCLDNFNRTGE